MMDYRILLFIFAGFLPKPAASQEMVVSKSSGTVEVTRQNPVVFFDTPLTADFIVPGNPETLQGKRVLTRLFQKVGEAKFLPLDEPRKSGQVVVGESGFARAEISVPIPALKTRTEMTLHAQIDDTKIHKTIHFTALADDLLARLAELHTIRFTGADQVAKAFRDREIKVLDGGLEDLKKGNPWSGIWFIGLTGDERKNMTAPGQLQKDQFVVIFEPLVEGVSSPFPCIRSKGQGWIIHFSETWGHDFTTNPGAQLALSEIINQIAEK